jgi:hypothetical protein
MWDSMCCFLCFQLTKMHHVRTLALAQVCFDLFDTKKQNYLSADYLHHHKTTIAHTQVCFDLFDTKKQGYLSADYVHYK